MSDENGRVAFMNTAARHLVARDGLGLAWQELFGLNSEDSHNFKLLAENRPRHGAGFRFISIAAMAGASGLK
jgi:nitrogen-specific signal transduction histidine kinase